MQLRSPGEQEISPVEIHVSVLNETFNNTRKYLKDKTKEHNVPPWCVFMPQNEGCMWGWYPVYFWIKLLLFLEHLEKKALTNAPQYVITVTCAFTSTL